MVWKQLLWSSEQRRRQIHHHSFSAQQQQDQDGEGDDEEELQQQHDNTDRNHTNCSNQHNTLSERRVSSSNRIPTVEDVSTTSLSSSWSSFDCITTVPAYTVASSLAAKSRTTTTIIQSDNNTVEGNVENNNVNEMVVVVAAADTNTEEVDNTTTPTATSNASASSLPTTPNTTTTIDSSTSGMNQTNESSNTRRGDDDDCGTTRINPEDDGIERREEIKSVDDIDDCISCSSSSSNSNFSRDKMILKNRQQREYMMKGYIWDSMADHEHDKKWAIPHVLSVLQHCQEHQQRLPLEFEFWFDSHCVHQTATDTEKYFFQVPAPIKQFKEILIARLSYWDICKPIVFRPSPQAARESNGRHFILPYKYINDIDIMIHVVQQQPWLFLPIHWRRNQPELFHEPPPQQQRTQQQEKYDDGTDTNTQTSSSSATNTNSNTFWYNVSFFLAFLKSIQRFDASRYHGVIMEKYSNTHPQGCDAHNTNSCQMNICSNLHCMTQLILTVPSIDFRNIVAPELLADPNFAKQIIQEFCIRKRNNHILQTIYVSQTPITAATIRYNHHENINTMNRFVRYFNNTYMNNNRDNVDPPNEELHNTSKSSPLSLPPIGFSYFHETIRDNEEIVKYFLQFDPDCYFYISDRLRHDNYNSIPTPPPSPKTTTSTITNKITLSPRTFKFKSPLSFRNRIKLNKHKKKNEKEETDEEVMELPSLSSSFSLDKVQHQPKEDFAQQQKQGEEGDSTLRESNKKVIEIAKFACLQDPGLLLISHNKDSTKSISEPLQRDLLRDQDFILQIFHQLIHEQLSSKQKGTTAASYQQVRALLNESIQMNDETMCVKVDYHFMVAAVAAKVHTSDTIPYMKITSICNNNQDNNDENQNYFITMKKFWEDVINLNPVMWEFVPSEYNVIITSTAKRNKLLMTHALASFLCILKNQCYVEDLYMIQNNNNDNKRSVQCNVELVCEQITKMLDKESSMHQDREVWILILEIAHSITGNDNAAMLFHNTITNTSSRSITAPTVSLLYWLSRAPATILQDKDLVLQLCHYDFRCFSLLEPPLSNDKDVVQMVLSNPSIQNMSQLTNAMQLFPPPILRNHISFVIRCIHALPEPVGTDNKLFDLSAPLFSPAFTIAIKDLFDDSTFRIAWAEKAHVFPNEYLKKYSKDTELFKVIAQRDTVGIWFRWSCRNSIQKDRAYMLKIVQTNGLLYKFAKHSDPGTLVDNEMFLYAMTNPKTTDSFMMNYDPYDDKHREILNYFGQYVHNRLNEYNKFHQLIVKNVIVATSRTTAPVPLIRSKAVVPCTTSSNLPTLNVGIYGDDLTRNIGQFVGVPTLDEMKLLQRASEILTLWGWW